VLEEPGERIGRLGPLPSQMMPLISAGAWVIDGDSIRCSNVGEIGLLGVDTPDYRDSPPCRGHFGFHVCDDQAAKAANRSLISIVLQTARRCASSPSHTTVMGVQWRRCGPAPSSSAAIGFMRASRATSSNMTTAGGSNVLAATRRRLLFQAASVARTVATW
jgi:hypothetical protein